MVKNSLFSIRAAPTPIGEVDPDELRLKLRTIARNEQVSCHLMQLELEAALAVANPGEAVRERASAVLAALAQAEKGYASLLAELTRSTRHEQDGSTG